MQVKTKKIYEKHTKFIIFMILIEISRKTMEFVKKTMKNHEKKKHEKSMKLENSLKNVCWNHKG